MPVSFIAGKLTTVLKFQQCHVRGYYHHKELVVQKDMIFGAEIENLFLVEIRIYLQQN